MDVAGLRVGDLEMLIRRMDVHFRHKFAVKRNDVRHQISLEFLHIFARPFSSHEFFPRFEKIFERYDIFIRMFKPDPSQTMKTPPHAILPVMHKIKDAYLLWHSFYGDLPKHHRYSFGQRIDSLFVETIEAIAAATFLSKEEKPPYIRLAIKKLDALKVLLMILWETESLDDKKYIALSVKLDEIGRNLGGWSGQLTKQNSPAEAGKK